MVMVTFVLDGSRALARHVVAWSAPGVVAGDRDRGDVPGWVLITLMTAGLVLALWAIAGPALTDVFSNAIQRVTGEIG
jgi:hypothetical protein